MEVKKAQRYSQKPFYIFCVFNVLTALLIGFFVYIAFRPDTYLSKVVYRIFYLGYVAEEASRALPEWFYILLTCYLCDMLWAYALTFTLGAVMSGYSAITIFSISSVFCFLIELTQLLGIMSGTFDVTDIILEVCVTALCVLIINFKQYKENRK